MTVVRQIYHCPICGNLVEMLFPGDGQLVCCGEPMILLEGNTEDATIEKHVPVLEDLGDKVKVSVGSVFHPIEDAHYIAFIEVHTENKIYRKELKPGDVPEAVFRVKLSKVLNARGYCNLHGLWKNEITL